MMVFIRGVRTGTTRVHGVLDLHALPVVYLFECVRQSQHPGSDERDEDIGDDLYGAGDALSARSQATHGAEVSLVYGELIMNEVL